jgi:hypothetical protein
MAMPEASSTAIIDAGLVVACGLTATLRAPCVMQQ